MTRRFKLNAETIQKVIYRGKQRLRTASNRRRAGNRENSAMTDEAFVRALNNQFQSVQPFLSHIQTRKKPDFFIDPTCRDDIAALANRHFPDSVKQAIAQANQTCDHIFDLLGSGPVFLGRPINWHKDFKVDWVWPPDYYADVAYMDLNQPYDVKVPWELSRFHHAVTLGQAYWFTNDERYAQEFVAQIDHWLDANPVGFGVNWTSTMDVAIRAVNWVWGYYFFKHSPSLPSHFQLRLFKGLLAHGQHIFSNLEWGLTTHNHYLSNLVGLIYLGIMFPEFKEAARWLSWGLKGLEQEMVVQVYADGVDYEGSTSYHRLVTELFLSATLLCRLNDISFSPQFNHRLEKMLEFVLAYTQPDGTAPLIGDADDGRLHKLTPPDGRQEFADHRHLLGIGAFLFRRNDFAKATGSAWEDAFWLSGGQILPPQNSIVLAQASTGFPQGGVYIQRDNALHLTIDTGHNGLNGIGGHAHNDALSITLYAYDKAFLVDPGSYVYTADYQRRNHFRSTKSHNVVVVDDKEMQRFEAKDIFRLYEDARPRVLAWQTTPEFDLLDAEQYGYARLPRPVVHRRQVFFDKKEKFWLIRDLLTGEGDHTFDQYFHFAPLPVSDFSSDAPLAVRTQCSTGANLIIVPLLTAGLTIRLFDDWISPSYGRKEKAPVVCYSKQDTGPVELVTALFPTAGGQQINLQDIILPVEAGLGTLRLMTGTN